MPWGSSPFPPISLQAAEKNELIRTAEALIDEFISTHGDFIHDARSSPDSTQWKPLREREGLRVYQCRHRGAGAGDANMQQLMTVGTVEGSLADVSYGFLNHTADAMHVRSVYCEDAFVDGAVLDTVLSPSQEQPFRSTTLRWGVLGLPLYVRAVCKNRDAVYLQATGTRALASGMTLGYQLIQSMEHKNAEPLPQCERSTVSVCTVWRQLSPGRVLVLSRSDVLLEDTFFESAAIKAFADAMLSVFKVGDCANRKKLSWLVQNRKTVQLDERRDSEGGTCCVACGDVLSDYRRSLKYACAVCTKPPCWSCRVKIDLAYVSGDGQLECRRTRFCVACVSHASRLDAAMVARDEAMAGPHPRKTLQPID